MLINKISTQNNLQRELPIGSFNKEKRDEISQKILTIQNNKEAIKNMKKNELINENLKLFSRLHCVNLTKESMIPKK